MEPAGTFFPDTAWRWIFSSFAVGRGLGIDKIKNTKTAYQKIPFENVEMSSSRTNTVKRMIRERKIININNGMEIRLCPDPTAVKTTDA